MGIPHPSELFSLHLNGRAKDFVEILMDLWPRYVCTRMCLMCVSLTAVSWRNTFTIDRGRGAEKKCVVLARISVTASCLHEPVFAPKGNNEVGGKKETLLMNMCVAALSKFSTVHNNLPLIYAFMKESPVGFWVCCKSVFVWRRKWLKSQADRNQKIADSSVTITA